MSREGNANQADRFIEAARELECNEDEGRFKECLEAP